MASNRNVREITLASASDPFAAVSPIDVMRRTAVPANASPAKAPPPVLDAAVRGRVLEVVSRVNAASVVARKPPQTAQTQQQQSSAQTKRARDHQAVPHVQQREQPPAAPAVGRPQRTAFRPSNASAARDVLQRLDTASPRAATAAAAPTSASTRSDDVVALGTFDEFDAMLAAEIAADGRLRPPVVGLAFVCTSGESNFSLSAKAPKVLFDADSPLTAWQRIAKFVATIEGHAFAWDGGITGASTVLQLLTRRSAAEFVCCNVHGVLFAAFHAHAAAATDTQFPTICRCVNDLRALDWLLHAETPMCSFDDMLARYCPTARGTAAAADSVVGTVSRCLLQAVVFEAMCQQARREAVLATYQAVEKSMPLVLAQMKYAGFNVDTTRVDEYAAEAAATMEQLKSRAAALIPSDSPVPAESFNIQSVDHCRKVLYDCLKLHEFVSNDDVTATGKVSTSEETLRALAVRHALPGLIVEYRKVAKLRQTYFEGVFSCAVPSREGRAIHANFLQHATDTGRLACADPNLQNLPRCASDELGSVRGAFVARSGHTLVALDYEQVELRVLAHASGDVCLRAALTSDDAEQRDVHRSVAARIYNKAFADVTPSERTAAKRVVFGVTYGMGPKALATQLQVPIEDARRIADDFRRSFPAVDRFIHATQETCRNNRCVRTLLNRTRHLADITAADPARRAAAERQAFNTVIQGSAADLAKKAMVDVHTRVLPQLPGAVMLCQIHDELVFSVPTALVGEAVPLLRTAMEHTMQLTVPLVVKASVGPNLADVIEVPR